MGDSNALKTFLIGRSCTQTQTQTQYNYKTQVRQIAAPLARSKGLQEGEVTGQLFGTLSLTLMRGNALMLT